MASKIKVDTIEQQGSSGIVLSHDVKLASGKAIQNAAGTDLLKEDGTLQATTIKHTNGTAAITINSDGSLSGKFEGAVKFKQIGRPSSGSPVSGKTWITFGITNYAWSTSGYAIGAQGQPCAVGAYNASGTASWTYLNQGVGGMANYGLLSASTSTATAAGAGTGYNNHKYTYTIEMDNV